MRSTRSLSWIRGALGLAPAPIPPHVFAIDAMSVRYGCFPRVGSALESREYHDVELPEEAFGDGLIGCAMREERSFRQGLDALLGRLTEPVTEASIVLPDSWLRVAFSETGTLPRSTAERDEILRWKLKQLVPFRVDDLRIQAIEVEPIAGSKEERRLMIGFGLELLLGQLEAAFSSYGIRIGWISNVSLSLLEVVWQAAGREGPKVVVNVSPDEYALALVDSGKPVLYRFKTVEPDRGDAGGLGVVRELSLTRAFVEDRIPELGDAPVFLFAAGGDEARWKDWLGKGLGSTTIHSGSELLRWGGQPIVAEACRVAPLMGAACTMVA